MPILPPTVLWIYGLSGAGKTTLATGVKEELIKRNIPCVLLDGDELRAGLNSDLGFSATDRAENIRRAAEVARLACSQGLVVLAAFITPTADLRAMARRIIAPLPFCDIYLRCDYATGAQRDAKGLYAKAETGELKNFTGKDSDFDEPTSPDLLIDTRKQDPNQCLQQLLTFLDQPQSPAATAGSLAPFTNPLTETMVNFLRSIGLRVERCTLDPTSFLPGLALQDGGIIIDEFKMLYPGDILHEAGHLAITPAAERHLCGGNLAVGGGEEMGAIAWSYAAALHLGIDPAVVFHPHGYRSGSDSLLENFRAGHYLAVPLLQWMGLTYDPVKALEHGCSPYPHMVRWLRA